ncbi:MAG: PIN domain-containing protein [archaeon]
MLLVIDANIAIAAIISKSKTFQLINFGFNELISPEFLIEEIIEHKIEVLKKAKLTECEFDEKINFLKSKITFIDLKQFEEFLISAASICPDKDDILYFALSLKMSVPIWSNDASLKKQNMIKVITTMELIDEIESKEEN